MNHNVQNDQGNLIPVRNIYCIGRNYRAHAAELNHDVPDSPFFYQKSIPALNSTNEIILPENRELHHEIEIVVLFGKDGEKISASIFDFALYFFHNTNILITSGTGPYFYLPKLESHLEAR